MQCRLTFVSMPPTTCSDTFHYPLRYLPRPVRIIPIPPKGLSPRPASIIWTPHRRYQNDPKVTVPPSSAASFRPKISASCHQPKAPASNRSLLIRKRTSYWYNMSKSEVEIRLFHRICLPLQTINLLIHLNLYAYENKIEEKMWEICENVW